MWDTTGPQPGQAGIQVIYSFFAAQWRESLTQVAKGRVSPQSRHHPLLQSNKASGKLNFLVKFYGWWQDSQFIHVKTQLSLGRKLFIGKPLNSYTEKPQPTCNQVHFWEKSIPKFCRGETGRRYSYPAHIHCSLPSRDQTSLESSSPAFTLHAREEARGGSGVSSFRVTRVLADQKPEAAVPTA